MIDFNHSDPSDAINHLIDCAIVQRAESDRYPRQYLGGSRLGEDCERKLQFEYLNTPKDTQLGARTYRIFEIGHALEEMAARWLKLAGFHLVQVEQYGPRTGRQFEATLEEDRIKCHYDGIIQAGPDIPGIVYPCLWECKSMEEKYFKDLKKNGLLKAHADYYGQVQTYQAASGLSNPALFTAVNKNTIELTHEAIPHAPHMAQRLIERGRKIVLACQRGTLLPRITSDPAYYKCKPAWCAYSARCWALKG